MSSDSHRGEGGQRDTTGGNRKARKATEIDQCIGHRLRMLRRLKNINQETLALGVGISFQQFQKYEKGSNRIPASRLYVLAEKLGVSVQYFFAGCRPIASANAELHDSQGNSHDDNHEIDVLLNIMEDIVRSHEGRRILRAFISVDNLEFRQKIADMMDEEADKWRS